MTTDPALEKFLDSIRRWAVKLLDVETDLVLIEIYHSGRVVASLNRAKVHSGNQPDSDRQLPA